MAAKNNIIVIMCMLFLISSVIAQGYKIEISTAKDIFEAGEKITIKLSLFDENNKPISDNVNVILENAEKTKIIERQIPSNQFVEIDLGEGTTHGYWSIKAVYNDAEATGIFSIEASELAKFEIQKDKLIITNIGNTEYTKTVQIRIGDTIGIKTPKLTIGESISYRLIAPEGVYNIKITDGRTNLERSDVTLTGTGKAIGAIDERVSQRSGITGITSPNEKQDEELFSYFRNSSFVYVFVLVIFGAMILLAIERNYRKKADK